MKFLLHGVHLLLVVGGAIGVCLLTEPALSQRWRVRRMRAAAQSGRLVEFAAASIRDAGTFRHVPRAPVVRALLAYSFAIVCTGCVVLLARLAGAPWPSWPVLAGTGGLSGVIGAILFRTRHRPRRVALAAVAVQVVLHPLVVIATEFAAYRRAGTLTSGFAAALFCHRAGQRPSHAQVVDAAGQLGLRVPSTSTVSAGGFLSPTATAGALALLAFGGLFAYWLCLDQPPGAAPNPLATPPSPGDHLAVCRSVALHTAR